jgi:type II secretion system protein N
VELPSLDRRQRRALKLGGYAAFFAGVFLLMTWLLFPFNRWKGTLEEVLSKQLERQVTIGSVGSWGLTGLKLRDVTIRQVEEEPEGREAVDDDSAEGTRSSRVEDPKRKKNVPLHIEKLGLRLALLPLVTGKVGVCFDARVFEGKVKGCFVDASRSLLGRKKASGQDGGPRSRLEVKLRNLDLYHVPQLEAMVGLPFHGIVDGKVDVSYVSGQPRTAEGGLELEIDGLQIGEPGAKLDLSRAGSVLQGELTFEPIVVGDLVVRMKGEGGVLAVEKLEASSEHIEIRGAGDVTLREPMLLSTLNIYVMFKFLPAYVNKSSMTKTIFSALDRVPKMRKAKRPDGFFGYLLRGDLRAGPKPVPSRSGPITQPSGGTGGIAPLPAGKSPALPMGLKSKIKD